MSGRVVANVRPEALAGAAEVESGGARLVNASSTDLLGLGADARVREATQAALRRFGAAEWPGSPAQRDLEERLAGLLGAEAAACVASVEAILSVLPGQRWLVEARSSRRLAAARPVSTPEEAEVLLERGDHLGVVTEAVHRLAGDLCVLPRYVETCQRRNASLIVVDEALGVLGPNGGGAVEHLALQREPDLLLITLGDGVPGRGAVVLGSRSLVEELRGATPVPPVASLAGSLRGLEIAMSESQRRERALELAQRALATLRSAGFDTGPCVTPWIPVWLGDEGLLHAWLAALADAQVACRGWVAGARSRLLLSFAATTTDAQLDAALEALVRTGKRLGYPEAAASFRAPPVLARPGSYAMGTPAALHWVTVEPPPEEPAPAPPPAVPPPPSSLEDLSLKGRVYDAVETLTWRATATTSAQLRRGADALRALLERRRR
jgi:7-keto-8-aminopelargonate synthetase-like enzyme